MERRYVTIYPYEAPYISLRIGVNAGTLCLGEDPKRKYTFLRDKRESQYEEKSWFAKIHKNPMSLTEKQGGLESRSFHLSIIQDGKIATDKVHRCRNSFYINLYSGTSKGLSVGGFVGAC
uniref:Uncharacterized protein n=1 Tax=Oryza sativa subsp. japonica TaxID=39947 RepID=Q10FX3_ORYSJ|nr:hypothetical protein LOC_Os03g44934 [Oryza sativa Japonica Group]